jgi:hypothetical protein
LIPLLSLLTISVGVFFGRAGAEPTARLITLQELTYGRDARKAGCAHSRNSRVDLTAACRIEIYEYTVLKTMLRALLSRPLLLGLVLAPLAIALVLLVHWLLAVT